jgi:elongation factor Ts
MNAIKRADRPGQGGQEGPLSSQQSRPDAGSSIAAKDVKALRDRTGAGMMDCKKALTEADGDVEKAIEVLRLRQGKKIQDLGERTATEGTVQAYIHAGAKVGVLIEVDCNTDFVATNDDFTGFARDIAMQIAATPTVAYVTREDVPAEAREAEARIYEQEAAEKPENVRERIVAGKLDAWYQTIVLLEQEMHNPKFEGKTVQQLRDELAAKTGENVVIRRFVRFAVGQ